MASLVALVFLFFTFIVPCSKASQFPALLSLACTPASNLSFMNNKSINILLDNLASRLTRTKLITSTVNLETKQYTGVMQCLPDLSSDLCALCAKIAKQTIQKLCPSATGVTAWFDGCYLQYNSLAYTYHYEVTSTCSLSNQTSVQNPLHFELNLEALLLRLRAEIFLTTHHRFSTGHIEYSNGRRIYALMKCIQSLSPEECGICVAKGTERVYEHCGGKEGGTLASSCCIVKYESYRFFSYFHTHLINEGSTEAGSGGTNDRDKEKRGEDDDDDDNFKVKVGTLLLWGIGVVCFVVIVFSIWLLKGSIINKAKVAAFSDI